MSDDVVKRLSDPLPAWREAQADRIAELEAALQKKGCARDQKTTQYCAEVISRDDRIAELEAALKPLTCSCTGFCEVMEWLPADNNSCVRRQGRAALEGGKE